MPPSPSSKLLSEMEKTYGKSGKKPSTYAPKGGFTKGIRGQSAKSRAKGKVG